MSADDKDHFDVLVLGTGVPESLLAAAHARRGDTVLHLDTSDKYGGAWANLTLYELLALSPTDAIENMSGFEHRPASRLDTLPPADLARFNFELVPKLLYAQGELVELFSTTGAGRHLDFNLVEGTYIHSSSDPAAAASNDAIQNTVRVPASKEDVFSSSAISLMEKRRLMKFFTDTLVTMVDFEEGENFHAFLNKHGLTGKLEAMLAHGVALLQGSSEQASAQDGIARIQKYLSSLGRYGNSPFLMALHGGGSELSQAMCRVSAVYGGVYILGRPVQDLSWSAADSQWTVSVAIGPNDLQTFTAKKLIGNPHTLSRMTKPAESSSAAADTAATSHHIIVVTNVPVRQDTLLGLFVVPSADGDSDAAVQVTQQSSELNCCPPGTFLLHARGASRSAVHAALGLLVPESSWLHAMHYTCHSDQHASLNATLARGLGLAEYDVTDAALEIVPGLSGALDIDQDIRSVLDRWKAQTGMTTLMETLPNPEDEQVVTEARQLQEAEGGGDGVGAVSQQ